MRPRSIVLFEQLFLASLVVSLIGLALGFNAVASQWSSDANVRAIGLGGGFLLATAAVSYLIYLLLWFLIARRGSNVAKWFLIAFVAIGVVSTFATLAANSHYVLTLVNALGLVCYALEVASLVFLFKPDANAWLKGERADPAAFE